jgi:glucose/arabinose dehydrogenase
MHHTLATILLTLALCACGDTAHLSVHEGMGRQPVLPPPHTSLLPTVMVAPAVGWPAGHGPTPAAGLAVNAFATGLSHPRWLYVLPNGDVLVAETNGPAHAGGTTSLRERAMRWFMRRAGALAPSADRITLLRDTDGDGAADQRTVFIAGLHSPFGMALVGTDFFVANTDAILRFPYQRGDTRITVPGHPLLDLPGGAINHHWTKNIIANDAGTHLYATVGSNSNVAENGLEQETDRATIWEIDLPGGAHRVFATGLRNPNGLAWEPATGALWTVVNERDELGSDLVPDYLTSVRRGGFYGWPYSYFGQHVDARVRPPRPDLVASALVPDYALGPHTGSLGLARSDATDLPCAYAEGMFVGQHGSWNRKPRSGYKVLFVPFSAGHAHGAALDVLDGFVGPEGKAFGRPVGVATDGRGALLVADDVGNTIWRVTAARPQRPAAGRRCIAQAEPAL